MNLRASALREQLPMNLRASALREQLPIDPRTAGSLPVVGRSTPKVS
jgi:hypothetical protein